MFKWFFLFISLFNGYTVYTYLFNNTKLSTITVAGWGMCVCLLFLAEFFKRLVIENATKRVKKELDEIILPIQKNINLTDEEKQERIAEAFVNKLKGEFK